jgi:hypothetical protein
MSAESLIMKEKSPVKVGRKTSRSDYSYAFKTCNQYMFLCIRDLNFGRMSVTNNIENIIEEIRQDNPEMLFDVVVYRDSDETWDAFHKGDFHFLGQNDTDAAITAAYLKLVDGSIIL